MKNKKGDLEIEQLIKLLIGAGVIVLIGGVLYLLLTGKLTGMLSYLKNLFIFRR